MLSALSHRESECEMDAFGWVSDRNTHLLAWCN